MFNLATTAQAGNREAGFLQPWCNFNAVRKFRKRFSRWYCAISCRWKVIEGKGSFRGVAWRCVIRLSTLLSLSLSLSFPLPLALFLFLQLSGFRLHAFAYFSLHTVVAYRVGISGGFLHNAITVFWRARALLTCCIVRSCCSGYLASRDAFRTRPLSPSEIRIVRETATCEFLPAGNVYIAPCKSHARGMLLASTRSSYLNARKKIQLFYFPVYWSDLLKHCTLVIENLLQVTCEHFEITGYVYHRSTR